MSNSLSARGISISFGGNRALNDVSLDVRQGQLVGLIGPNGAGKTTFIDGLSGFAPVQGSIELDGADISRLNATQRARHGLSRTWQSSMLFDDLTVAENVAVASDSRSWWSAALTGLRLKPPSENSLTILARLGIDDLADRSPSSLTQGQQKLVGVARALASKPSLVCLDEPAAGLDTYESQVLGRQLRAIVDGGTSMLLIDHDMGLVLSICDEVVVLDFGNVIFKGTPDAMKTDPQVIEAYLGTSTTPESSQIGAEHLA